VVVVDFLCCALIELAPFVVNPSLILLSFPLAELLLLRQRMLIGICNYEALSSPFDSVRHCCGVGVGLGWVGLVWFLRWLTDTDSRGPKEAPE